MPVHDRMNDQHDRDRGDNDDDTDLCAFLHFFLLGFIRRRGFRVWWAARRPWQGWSCIGARPAARSTLSGYLPGGYPPSPLRCYESRSAPSRSTSVAHPHKISVSNGPQNKRKHKHRNSVCLCPARKLPTTLMHLFFSPLQSAGNGHRMKDKWGEGGSVNAGSRPFRYNIVDFPQRCILHSHPYLFLPAILVRANSLPIRINTSLKRSSFQSTGRIPHESICIGIWPGGINGC